MANAKYLDTALTTFSKYDTASICEDGEILVSIVTILNALKEYEIGVPQEYFARDGVYFGIASWLEDEKQKGNIELVGADNTFDMASNVSVDFGFAQYDSLVGDDTFVLVHVHAGAPFLRESLQHNNYPAMLFRFEKGTSFYDVLDNIVLENPDVPSITIEVSGRHYLVLPSTTNESYYVKCLETGEELSPNSEMGFNGNEEHVKAQIESYIRMRKAPSTRKNN